MKAVVKNREEKHQVSLQDVDIPSLKKGEVLLKVGAAGICGTDIHIYEDGSYPIQPPVTLGHEISGTVVKTADDVGNVQTGDRVVSETYYSTCKTCEYCISGHKNLCEHRVSIGSGVNGGMAEYIAVPAENIHRIPDSICFEEAAMTEPLACCVQAVFEYADLKPEDCVLISGPGTIGLLCVQLIQLFGCKVIVMGTRIDTERLRLAQKFGAEKIIYSDEEHAVSEVKKFCKGRGADVSFDCSGAGKAVQFCIQSLRKGGTHIQVGLTAKPVVIDMNDLALREICIKGTFAQKPIWWERSLQLIEDKKIDLAPLITRIHKLEDWKEGFQDVIEGKGLKHILVP